MGSASRVLITGANGMLGQDLSPALEDNGYDVIETDIDTLDITDPNMVDAVISKETPNYIIHCAAYTNVDEAEKETDIARLINIKGTENLAKTCLRYNLPIVYISTDYVFDGKKTTPYKPDDEPNPINNYGLTKWNGEKLVKYYCKNHYIVRTSWLYGHHGSNFVEKILALSDKPELKVVADQIGCPTWTVDLSDGIIKLLKNEEYGTFHICGSGETSWYGFALEIFKQLGVSANIKPCTTDEFPRTAKRPKYSVLDNNGICRDWKLALNDYLKLRNEG